MLYSMTGFASQTTPIQSYCVRFEMRSVNHRYLDIQMRLPEDFRFLEPLMRQAISNTVTRGKIECKVMIESSHQRQPELNIHEPTLHALMAVNQKICAQYPQITPLSMADILHYPNVIVREEINQENFQNDFLLAFEKLLSQFKQDRKREGEALQQHLAERLILMTDLIDQLHTVFPVLLQNHKDKINQRLMEALGEIDHERLQQEFALFMQKADVDEEFSRLRTHIAEVQRIISDHKAQSVGKRLDFLMQELNREANTLGSKSIAVECTQTSVELKVIIEQMREQVQNIE